MGFICELQFVVFRCAVSMCRQLYPVGRQAQPGEERMKFHEPWGSQRLSFLLEKAASREAKMWRNYVPKKPSSQVRTLFRCSHFIEYISSEKNMLTCYSLGIWSLPSYNCIHTAAVSGFSFRSLVYVVHSVMSQPVSSCVHICKSFSDLKKVD